MELVIASSPLVPSFVSESSMSSSTLKGLSQQEAKTTKKAHT